jgi:Protein of unknown function, DUF547
MKEDKETNKGAERGSQDQHDSNNKHGRDNRKEGRSDSFAELSRTVFDWKESQIVNDSSNNNTNQSHRSVYNRESSGRSNGNSNNNSPQPVQRNRNSTVTCDNYGNNHPTLGINASGLNPHHAGMSSFYHTPNTHTADDLHNDYMSDEVQALWIQFMDGVALLQAADVSHLNPASDEALCMFLNLYHLMVIHSCLVIGPPCSAYKVCVLYSSHLISAHAFTVLLFPSLPSPRLISTRHSSLPLLHFSHSSSLSSHQWVGFFGYVSYEVFGDFISIAELEHCILRNGEFTHRTTVMFSAASLIMALSILLFLRIYCFSYFLIL